jgi:hypothetical protein
VQPFNVAFRGDHLVVEAVVADQDSADKVIRAITAVKSLLPQSKPDNAD